MARDVDRQVAELQVRAAILNRFPRLGTPTAVAVTMPSFRLGFGALGAALICATKPLQRVNAKNTDFLPSQDHLCEDFVICKTTWECAVFSDQGKDEFGNYTTGITPQQAQDAGVNPSDHWLDTVYKVQEMESKRCAEHLEKYGPDRPSTNGSGATGSSVFKKFLLSFILFCAILYAWVHLFSYLLEVFVFPREATHVLSQTEILHRTLMILAALVLTGFSLWYKLFKFLKARLC